MPKAYLTTLQPWSFRSVEIFPTISTIPWPKILSVHLPTFNGSSRRDSSQFVGWDVRAGQLSQFGWEEKYPPDRKQFLLNFSFCDRMEFPAYSPGRQSMVLDLCLGGKIDGEGDLVDEGI